MSKLQYLSHTSTHYDVDIKSMKSYKISVLARADYKETAMQNFLFNRSIFEQWIVSIFISVDNCWNKFVGSFEADLQHSLIYNFIVRKLLLVRANITKLKILLPPTRLFGSEIIKQSALSW